MKGNGWKIPIAYEKYGYIEVTKDEAATKEEAVKIAQQRLEKMTVAEMEAISEYLPDSEEVDEEGVMEL